MTEHQPRSPARDATFFGALAGGKTVDDALVASGYARVAVRAWRTMDRTFAAAWDNAVADSHEAAADARLHDRYLKPIYCGGEVIGHRNVCFDPLLFARYEALRRQRDAARNGVTQTPAEPPALRAMKAAPRDDRWAWRDWLATLLTALLRVFRSNAR